MMTAAARGHSGSRPSGIPAEAPHPARGGGLMHRALSAPRPVESSPHPGTPEMDGARHVRCGVLNPEHAQNTPSSRGNGDAVSVGCPFWSPA